MFSDSILASELPVGQITNSWTHGDGLTCSERRMKGRKERREFPAVIGKIAQFLRKEARSAQRGSVNYKNTLNRG